MANQTVFGRHQLAEILREARTFGRSDSRCKPSPKQQSACALLQATHLIQRAQIERPVCCAAALTAAPSDTEPSTSKAEPSSAETARSILELVSHGTLSTLGEDGVPLGTYASFVLDPHGQPILRLRSGAVHTANLLANPRCSLFVQPDMVPGRLLARATLVGQVRFLVTPRCLFQYPVCVPFVSP